MPIHTIYLKVMLILFQSICQFVVNICNSLELCWGGRYSVKKLTCQVVPVKMKWLKKANGSMNEREEHKCFYFLFFINQVKQVLHYIYLII